MKQGGSTGREDQGGAAVQEPAPWDAMSSRIVCKGCKQGPRVPMGWYARKGRQKEEHTRSNMGRAMKLWGDTAEWMSKGWWDRKGQCS